MTRPERYGLPEQAIARRRFDRAAATLEQADVVAAEARARLLERLALFSIEPAVVLDLGAANASASRALALKYPSARILAADTSAALLARARVEQAERAPITPLQADAQALPCRDGSVDLVFANLLLPWVDPDRLFAECARVLKPGGLTLLTTLGPDTLIELRRAWARVDEFIHVHGFIDMHDLGDLAGRAGLVEPVVDVDRLTLRYKSATALIADLRGSGAVNTAVGRRPGLTGRGRWAAFEGALTAQFLDGELDISIELIFLQAWAGDVAPAAGTSDGLVRIAADTLAETARKRR